MAATLRLLGEQRASAITVQAIAEEAGHSRSLVYRHFGDKEALVGFAIFGELERWAEIVRAAPDPVSGFVAAYDHLLGHRALTRAQYSIFGEVDPERPPTYPVVDAHTTALQVRGVDPERARRATVATMSLYTTWAAAEGFWTGAGGFDDNDAQRTYGRQAIVTTLEALTGRPARELGASRREA